MIWDKVGRTIASLLNFLCSQDPSNVTEILPSFFDRREELVAGASVLSVLTSVEHGLGRMQLRASSKRVCKWIPVTCDSSTTLIESRTLVDLGLSAFHLHLLVGFGPYGPTTLPVVVFFLFFIHSSFSTKSHPPFLPPSSAVCFIS
jgi:hypothetical protein